MAVTFNTARPTMGGRVSAPTGQPARGASAINAAAREKAAHNAAMAASRQTTANQSPAVHGLVGTNPIRQEAYEQQAHTQLQGDLARQQQAAAGQQRMGELQYGNTSAQEQARLAAELQQKQDAARAGLSKDAFDHRLGAVTSLPLPGGEVGAPPTPGAPGPGAGDPNAGAAAAAFARAKDQQGQIGRSAVDSLRGLMSETGNLGGGQEMAGMASILNGAQGQLGELNRDQLMQRAARAAQIEDRNYSGNLARRGQDLNYRQSLLGLISGGGGIY